MPLGNVSKLNFAWRRAFKGGVKQSREKGGISVRMCPRAAAAFTQSHRVVGIASEARWWRRRRSGGVSVRERRANRGEDEIRHKTVWEPRGRPAD